MKMDAMGKEPTDVMHMQNDALVRILAYHNCKQIQSWIEPFFNNLYEWVKFG